MILFYRSEVSRHALTFEIKMVLGNLEYMIWCVEGDGGRGMRGRKNIRDYEARKGVWGRN